MPKVNNLWVLIVFSGLILAAYANSFHAAWHFDDKPNILNNTHLHIDNLKVKTLVGTLYSNPNNPYKHSKKMFRPVTCLTFALNWYVGQDDPFGYRLTNVILHILTSFFIYCVILVLYTTPKLTGVAMDESRFVAILATVLWAVNPVHTQAVTYIVQRMAVMAGLFYVLGIYAFLKARLTVNGNYRLLSYAGCLICYVLALGSKENAVTLPISLILLEFIFFRDLNRKSVRQALIGVIAISGIILVIIAVGLFLKGDFSAGFRAYDSRPFSMGQRLLTEFRILVYYLSLIFHPSPTRLSIEHDIVISTSLWYPWTTLPSLLLLLVLFFAGIACLKRNPLIGFSILFFFGNHVIESSIIPLELIFEHRNYLPSFFIFVPVAIGLNRISKRYGHTSLFLRYAIGSFIVLLVVGFGTGTSIRNRAWTSEKSLWEDAALKAPGSARPLSNLAYDMAYGKNAHPRNYDKALKLYAMALNRYQARDGLNAAILNNMAGIYAKKENYPAALEHLERALAINPKSAKVRADLVTLFLRMGRLEEASVTMDPLLQTGVVHEGHLNRKALILMHQGESQKAIPYLEKSLALEPYFQTTLIYLGTAYNLAGRHIKAEQILGKALNKPPSNFLPLVCLMDNSLRSGERERAIHYADLAVRLYHGNTIRNLLEKYRSNNLIPPLLLTDISQLLLQRLNGIDK